MNDNSSPSQKHKSWTGLFPPGAVAISIAAVLSTAIAAHTWKEVRKKPERNNIRITGSAKKRILSDLIQWSATIQAVAPERTAAYVALKSGTEKVVAFLNAEGIKPDDLQTHSATITEEFETIREDKVIPGTSVAMHSERKESKGFRAIQVVSVSSSNVDQVEKASRKVTELLEQGISVISSPPNYFYTGLGELKVAMLAEAAKDARSRAETILHSAGNTAVGKLVYADMGIININPANSTQTSNEGNNDTTAREKDIITIIHATYEVE